MKLKKYPSTTFIEIAVYNDYCQNTLGLDYHCSHAEFWSPITILLVVIKINQHCVLLIKPPLQYSSLIQFEFIKERKIFVSFRNLKKSECGQFRRIFFFIPFLLFSFLIILGLLLIYSFHPFLANFPLCKNPVTDYLKD